MLTRAALLVAMLLTASLADARAQVVRPGGRRAFPPVARLGRAAAGDSTAENVQLQRQLRQATARIAQQRLGLTDEQMHKLAAVNRKYEAQRRDIAREEQETRQAMRREMQGASAPDQTQVAKGMDHLIELQQRRLQLLQEEQKDLSEFMTPVQRAKYHALQEQLRQRAQALRRQQMQEQQQPNRGTDPFGSVPDSTRRRPPRP